MTANHIESPTIKYIYRRIKEYPYKRNPPTCNKTITIKTQTTKINTNIKKNSRHIKNNNSAHKKGITRNNFTIKLWNLSIYMERF